jgi:hypothetical protein
MLDQVHTATFPYTSVFAGRAHSTPPYENRMKSLSKSSVARNKNACLPVWFPMKASCSSLLERARKIATPCDEANANLDVGEVWHGDDFRSGCGKYPESYCRIQKYLHCGPCFFSKSHPICMTTRNFRTFSLPSSPYLQNTQ